VHSFKIENPTPPSDGPVLILVCLFLLQDIDIEWEVFLGSLTKRSLHTKTIWYWTNRKEIWSIKALPTIHLRRKREKTLFYLPFLTFSIKAEPFTIIYQIGLLSFERTKMSGKIFNIFFSSYFFPVSTFFLCD
jgi:hypothetical protein